MKKVRLNGEKIKLRVQKTKSEFADIECGVETANCASLHTNHSDEFDIGTINKMNDCNK